MKRPLLFTLCLLATGRLVFAAPELSVDKVTVDFGERNHSQPVYHTFKLRNTGDEKLVIRQIQAKCGCTAAELERYELEPGEQVDLKASMVLERFLGKISKAIIVISNDPVRPQLPLVFKGVAVTAIERTPPSLYFIPRTARDTETQQVKISATDPERPLQLKLKSWPKEQFDVKLETVKPKQEYLVSVTSKPLKPGNQHLEVLFETNIPEQQEVGIKLIAFRNAEKITLSRKEIFLSKQSKKPVSLSILLRPAMVETFEILGVDLPDDRMRSHVTTTPSGSYLVRLSEIHPVDEINGKPVVIRTDVTGLERIEIPIFIE